MSSQDPKEELVRLLPLSGQTKEENTPNAAQKCLEDNKIDLKKRRVSRHNPLQETKRDLFEVLMGLRNYVPKFYSNR
ncbi:hypothetical protein TNCV_1225581 [Trichonephila clavipes]|nr:hypothetical protein TNCV_1225581 [Trichonephila clavipes]